MRKLTLILLMLFVGSTAFGQSRLKQINEKWEQTEDDRIAFRERIPAIHKASIAGNH
jgi:hypothetical protein